MNLANITSSTIRWLFFLGFSLSAATAAPRLFVTPERLTALRTLVNTPGTHHQAAFAVMMARVNQNDWRIYDEDATDGNWNYARGWQAREAALAYLLTGNAQYATFAYQACEDMYLDPDPDGRLPDDGYGLSRAANGLSFAIAYDFAAEGMTTAQRDWLRGKLISTLNNWPSYSHENLENPDRASNWVGVCRGSELVVMLAAREEVARASRFALLKSDLATHMANAYGEKGFSQEGSGYTGYTMTFLLPAIYALESVGDRSLRPYLVGFDTFRHIVSHFTLSYEKYTQRYLTTPEPQVLTTGVDNHGGDSMGTGWLSLAWQAIRPSQKGHYRWFYDRVLGTSSPRLAAEKFESQRAGIIWSILCYDETAVAVDPNGDAGFELFTFDGVRGAYFFRNRFERHNEVLVNLMGDYSQHGNAWNNAETFDLGIIAHGMRFAGSPGKNGHIPDRYSTLLVNGAARANPNHTGRPVLAEGGLDGGGYVVVDGGTKYRALGLDSARRHLFVDFSVTTGDAVIATLDRLRVQTIHQYTWQLNIGGTASDDNPPNYDEGITGTLSTEGGRPAFTLTGINQAGETVWLKGWVLSHPEAVISLGDPLKVNITGANEDLWIVMLTGKGTAPAGFTQGSGLGTQLIVGSTRVAFDAAADRIFTYADGGPVARLAVANGYGTPGTTAQFDASATIDSSGGSIVSYHWNFGDGQSATTTGPMTTHTYTTRGHYRVVVTAVDNDGLTGNADAPVNIFDTISVNLGPESRLLLDDEPAGPVPRSHWNTGQTLFNLRNDVGADTFASLIVQEPFAARSGGNPSTPDEKVAYSSISADNRVVFEVASLPSVFTQGGYEVIALWNTPSTPGVVRVTLGGQSYFLRDSSSAFEGVYERSTATTAAAAVAGRNYVVFSGLSAPSFQLVAEAAEGTLAGLTGLQIRALSGSSNTPSNLPPVARMEADRLSGVGPLLVTFDASSSYDPNGTIFRYEWKFGDGATATGPVVSHRYQVVGSYEAELRVIDNNGVASSAFRTISVLPREGDDAVVRINFQPLLAPLIPGYLPDYGAPFADRGNGFRYGWQSSRQAATFDFNSPWSPDERYDTAVDFNEFGENNGWSIDLPNGDYDVRLVAGGEPSTNSNNSFLLDNLTLSDLDPFLVPDIDEYMATVTLQDGNLDVAIPATNQRQFLNFIEVYPHRNQPPAAAFAANPGYGVAPLAVSFDARASIDDKPIASYSWDFGDGTSGSSATPGHTYAAPGVYTVILTVTDTEGVQSRRHKTIYVTDGSPVALIDAFPTAGPPPLEVSFDGGRSFDTDGGAITAYHWDFGDGQTSTEIAPTHLYSTNGVFTIRLTVTDNTGRSAQTDRQVFVSAGSTYGLSAASQLGDAGDADSVRGVRILADGSIVLAANIGTANPGGLIPSVLVQTGATSYSGGTIIHLSADGRTVLSALRVAGEVVDLSLDSRDGLYVAAGYDGLIYLPTPTTFGWRRLVGAYVHRVDASPDGQTAALVPSDVANRESNAGSGRIYHHGPDGTLLHDFAGTQNTLDVAIDQARQSIYLIGWRQVARMRGPPGECVNGGTPRLPVQIAYLRACAFDGTVKWHSYSWDTATILPEYDTGAGTDVNACPYVDPAYPDLTPDMLNPRWLNRYTNNMADTRGTRVVLGDDGQLYAGFEAAGGNHIFRWDPYDLSRAVPIVGGDAWHQFVNTGASHKTFVAKYDPATGNYLQGQHLNTVFVSTTGPGANALRLKEGDLHADAEGRLFVVGSSASGLPFSGSPLYVRQPGQVEFNPFPPEYYTGGAYLLVLSPDFKTREYVTRLTGGTTHAVHARRVAGRPFPQIAFGGSDGDLSGSPVGVIPFYGVHPLQSLRGGGAKDGFFAVLGGVGGQVPDVILTPSVTSGRAPLAISFDTAGSTDVDGAIVSFAWNFGDGQSGSGAAVSHTFAQPGTYRVSVTATDNDGFLASRELTITVFPVSGAVPVADAGPDQFVVAGADGTAFVTLDGSASVDPDGNLRIWKWTRDGVVVAANQARPTFTLVPGEYLFTLEVTDQDSPANHSSSDTVRVQVYPTGTLLLTWSPADDTYVRALDYADTNYGGQPELRASGGRFNEPQETWIRFDFRALAGNLIDAELWLHPVSITGSGTVFRVAGVEDDHWNEYSLKWSNRPLADTPLAEVVPLAGQPTIVDLAGPWFLRQQTLDGWASLRLAAAATVYQPVAWHSRESTTPAFRPVLRAALRPGDGALPVAAFTASPASGPRPLPVRFDATASTDNTGIVAYSWDFGDGSPTIDGAVVDHTFSSPGNYTVTLTATDASGLFDTAVQVVEVHLGEPLAALRVTPVEGLRVLADAGASLDVNGTIAHYAFNFGDGTTFGSAQPTASHTYAAPGNYLVAVTVTDNEGYTDTAVATVTVNHGEPVAMIAADVTSGQRPLAVHFDASGSQDYDGTIVSYTWDFGDGSAPLSGISVNHTFTASGRFEVTLTVVDDDGRSAVAVRPIIVNIELKGISVNFGKSGVAAGLLAPSAMAGVVPLAYWNNADRSSTGAHRAGLTGALDSNGQPTTVAFSWTNTARNIYATAGIDPNLSPDHNMLASYYGNIGDFTEDIVITGIPADYRNQWYDLYVYWGGKQSDNSEGGCLQLQALETGETFVLTDKYPGWNGNHLAATAASCAHASDGPTYVRFQALRGENTVLRVTASGGQRLGISGIQLVYNPGLPYPSASVVTSHAFTGLPVAFDASASTDNGTIVSYLWDFGDGKQGNGVAPAHVYAEPGRYEVTVTVTDDFGLSASARTSVVVNPQGGGPSISINLGEATYSVATNDLFGVVPRFFWNNANTGTVANLVDQGGRPTGAAFIGPGQTYRTLVNPDHAAARMMKSFAGGLNGTVTFRVTGLPPEFTANGYDLYLYLGGGREGDASDVTYTVAGRSLALKYAAGQFWDGTHTRSYASSPAQAVAGSDYVVFEGLMQSDLEIAASLAGRGGLSGMQIVARATIAAFTPSVRSGPLPLTVNCDARATQGAGMFSYYWDWGDGQTSTGIQASHTYTSAGVYEIVLTATASGTGVGTARATIEVYDPAVSPPQARAAASLTTGTAPQTIFFDASASTGQGPLSYSWDFGDGTTATGAVVGHTFAANGFYRVQLQVRNAGGVDRATLEITLTQPNIAPPSAAFAASPSTGQSPLRVTLDASGTTGPLVPTNYIWDFGDGTTGFGRILEHVFTDPGTYMVTLWASNAGGVSQAHRNITVLAPLPPGAASISINFGSQVLLPTDTAGVEPRAFWNNVNSTATLANLLDSDGMTTTAAVVCSAGNNYITADTVLDTGDQKMMKSYRGTQSAQFTVTLNGLPATYQARGYDLIVYFAGRDNANYTPEYAVGTEKRYLRDNNGTWDGVHRESTAAATSEAPWGHNYVRWRGLTTESITLTVKQNGGAQRYGISGLQVIPRAREPLTFSQKLAEVELDPNDWVIVIPSVYGWHYELRQSPSLGSHPTGWPLAAGPVAGDGSVLEFRLPKVLFPAEPTRFFVIVIKSE